MSSGGPPGRGGGSGGRRNNRGGRGGSGRGSSGRGGGGGGGRSASESAGPSSQKGGNKSNRRGGDDKKAEMNTTASERPSAEDVATIEERKRQEEEQKRLEAERKAAEANRKAQEKQSTELQEKIQAALETLEAIVESTKQRRESRELFAAESLVEARKTFEASKKSLKSDLKKCTAFVKKVKSGSAWSMRPHELTKDVATLNLSRYVEEVAAAVTESRWKVADIPVVMALCRAMHERYADFLPTLVPALWSTINSKVTEETAKLRRLYARLMTEFVMNGMGSETKHLVKLVAEASGASDGSYAVTDASIVVSFAKTAGFEVFGTRPKSIQGAIDLLNYEVERAVAAEKSELGTEAGNVSAPVMPTALRENALAILPQVEQALEARAVGPKVSEVLLTHCMGTYDTLSKSLVTTHDKLQKLEKRCEQDRLLAGGLSDAREKGLSDARKLLDSLLKSVETLSDILVQTVPELTDEKGEDEHEKGVGLELWTKEGQDGEGADFGPFDDEETRAFYCDIPDLLSTIPPALLNMSTEEIELKRSENAKKYGDGSEGASEMAESDSSEIVPSSEADLEADEAEEVEGTEEEMDVDTGGADEENKDTPHYRLMVFLESELPECSRREQVDELAEKFCVNHGSSKNARKRLTRTMFMVPRSRMDLLPFYSRLATVVDRVFSDIAPPLVQELEQQFHGQAKFKKNQNVESRLKTARFLGELTKFRVAPPIVSLRCLRRCLDDFSGFNIDVACCILESCGRYLLRTKHTSTRISSLMDTMTRISKAKNLDERAKALISSAMYSVKPPPAGPKKQAKVYPPLEAYLRDLLLVRLVPEGSSISFVTKQLGRFPWDDPSQQCGALICKYMMKACRKGRYKAINAVAAVAAKFKRTKPEVATRLLDNVLEELRWSLEHPDFRDQQRSITYAKLLGELYRLSVAPAQIVIQQLFDFVNIGHEIPEALREASAKLESGESTAQSDLALLNSSKKGISQTIQEDEELDEDAMQGADEEVPEPQQQVVAVSRHSKYDPRVPTQADPPNAVLRIQLVCTLLESASTPLLSRSNIQDTEKFLVAFQRYLFTKTSLPTEVEFALLDTFDVMDSRWRSAGRDAGRDRKDSGFPRFKTWLEAHNATVAFEEAEALTDLKTRARLEGIAGLSQGTGETDSMTGSEEADDESVGLSLASEDASMEDHSASVSDSASYEENEEMGESGSISDESSQEDEDASDEETSEGSNESDADDLGSSEEEAVDEEELLRQLEEEAFERELRRMTMEALEKGKSTAGRKVADTMPSGSQFIRKKAAETTQDTAGAAMALGGKEGISFQLLKKGNKGKVEAKSLVVPSDTNLAKVATKQDDEAARERDLLKARVLEYEAQSAEQDNAGGNVYLEESKLQTIRNRPLSIEEIDKNFGSTRGETPGSVNRRPGAPSSSKPRSHQGSSSGRGRGGGSGRSGGRGRGRSGRGRSLV